MNERERELTERKKREAKEAREAKKAAKKKPEGERNPEAAAKAGGKKHKITARKVGKFIGTQVFDALLAATVATILFKTTAITGTAELIIGFAAFGVKKLINAGVRYGKKHIIKKRKKPYKPNGKKMRLPRPVAGAITVAGAALPLALIANPIAIPVAGIAAVTMAKLTGLFTPKHKNKTDEEEDEYDRTR